MKAGFAVQGSGAIQQLSVAQKPIAPENGGTVAGSGTIAPESGRPENPKDAIGGTKVPLHLVSPIAKAYAAVAHFLGNVKYGAWNWRGCGARASIYKSALDRHMDRWWSGEELDPVDGTPHLANALCCINILIETQYAGNMIDDRPPKVDVAEAYAMVEALMPKIRERYADKLPKDWTIADKV